MKKKLLVFFVCGAVIGIIIWNSYSFFSFTKKQDVHRSSQQQIPLVTLVIDDGDRIATYQAIPAGTVFSALYDVCQKNAIPLKTKQYDFGVFVEQIGDKANTSDRAWIYRVNGTSGAVAGDKYDLHSGDTILWQYTKPIF